MLLITGGSGFLGSNVLYEALADGRDVAATYFATTIRNPHVRAMEADLSQIGAADELLESLRPDWVVNCAALANVDLCERDPDLALRINVEVPRLLAESCQKAEVRFLHISTDAVFDGQRGGYDEDDPAAPLNVYARTKLEGEKAVFDKMLDALVVRTNFVGYTANGQTGLAQWIIRELSAGRRIKGFSDVIIAPLVANDLARILFEMMDANLSGLYHVAGSTPVSKLDFARKLAMELELDETLIQPATVGEANLPAPRPLKIWLSPHRVEENLGKRMPSIDESISTLGELSRANHSHRLKELLGN